MTYHLEIHATCFPRKPKNWGDKPWPQNIKKIFEVQHFPHEGSYLAAATPCDYVSSIELTKVSQRLDGTITANWQLPNTGYLYITNPQEWIDAGWEIICYWPSHFVDSSRHD